MIDRKLLNFSPSGIAVDIWNQIFIGESKTYNLGESKTDIPLPIRKLSNDTGNHWNLLKTYKLTNGNHIDQAEN